MNFHSIFVAFLDEFSNANSTLRFWFNAIWRKICNSQQFSFRLQSITKAYKLLESNKENRVLSLNFCGNFVRYHIRFQFISEPMEELFSTQISKINEFHLLITNKNCNKEKCLWFSLFLFHYLCPFSSHFPSRSAGRGDISIWTYVLLRKVFVEFFTQFTDVFGAITIASRVGAVALSVRRSLVLFRRCTIVIQQLVIVVSVDAGPSPCVITLA